jgi:cytochrome c-type biogenesis protein CcmE
MDDSGGVMTDTLTPQTPRPSGRKSRRWIPAVVAGLVLVAVALLSWNLFTGALFFYNADEAIEQRVDLGSDRFTLQGTPVECSITTGTQAGEPVTAFSLAFGGATIDVVHRGDPAELFKGGVPVVLDGAWVEADPGVDGFVGLANDGWYYESDRMRVKHDEDYINEDEYDDRVTESENQALIANPVCGS